MKPYLAKLLVSVANKCDVINANTVVKVIWQENDKVGIQLADNPDVYIGNVPEKFIEKVESFNEKG